MSRKAATFAVAVAVALLLGHLASPAFAVGPFPSTLESSARSAYRNSRWLFRGIGSELLTNVAPSPRPPRPRAIAASPPDGGDAPDPDPNPDPDGAPVAVVTGATGGIGTEICRGLSAAGYRVVAAARDAARGEDLARRLRDEFPPGIGGGGGVGDGAAFVEWHAEDPDSSLSVASALRGRPVALLVNNAGTMGGPRSETMRVNLIGPASLTLALLPSLRLHPRPRVVDVGSSSHLRAGRVDPSLLGDDGTDADLGAYGQSKLGLMLFSTLLRRSLPWLEVVDAHPGLVWTPMLRGHWGKLAPVLERTGAVRILFKTPEEGAATILAAALDPLPWRDVSPHVASAVDGSESDVGRIDDSDDASAARPQAYYVNGRPGGYASPESFDELASLKMWKEIVFPALVGVLPEACREVEMRKMNASSVVEPETITSGLSN